MFKNFFGRKQKEIESPAKKKPHLNTEISWNFEGSSLILNIQPEMNIKKTLGSCGYARFFWRIRYQTAYHRIHKIVSIHRQELTLQR